MRATGFTDIAFPHYTPTQAKVSCSADRRRARGALRAGRIGQSVSTVTTEISTGTPSIERKRSC
jgi:hypothetical protein